MLAIRANALQVWQCVRPDHNHALGTGDTAELTVPSADSIESSAAPADGIVLVSLPAEAVARIRIGLAVEALVTDHAFYGPFVYALPILAGEVVSLWGDGGTFAATVSMAR